MIPKESLDYIRSADEKDVDTLLTDYRETIRHHEDAMSSADGLRQAMEEREA